MREAIQIFVQPDSREDAFQVTERGIGSPDAEVISDGPVKENRLRRQIADRRAQTCNRQGTNIDPRDENLARVNVVKARQESCERAFPSAIRPRNGNTLSLENFQTPNLENIISPLVAERNVPARDVQRDVRSQRFCIRVLFHGWDKQGNGLDL